MYFGAYCSSFHLMFMAQNELNAANHRVQSEIDSRRQVEEVMHALQENRSIHEQNECERVEHGEIDELSSTKHRSLAYRLKRMHELSRDLLELDEDDDEVNARC